MGYDESKELSLELLKHHNSVFLRRCVIMEETGLSVFRDAHGILFIDYLKKRKIISDDYYMARKTATLGKKTTFSTRQCTTTYFTNIVIFQITRNAFQIDPASTVFSRWLTATSFCS